MISLKDYQEHAVKNLVTKMDNLSNNSENSVCVLNAPTGSGKTIICAELLKRFVNKNSKKFSFIWISVRKLHNQSKDNIAKYYDSDQTLTCSYFEELIDKKIDENEILFINWESINRKNISIIIRESELENDLNTVLDNTRKEGRQIILIIDESHHTAGADRSKELITIMDPKITLEVSATPALQGEASEIEKITLSAVKEEEMIKSEITVNTEFGKIKLDSKSTTELVLEQALKKREELKKLFQKENSDVNPLILIQLPDKKENQDKKKDEVIKILKENYDVSEEKGNMAVWLSEEKSSTLPNIEKQDSEVDVLLFKQAIALGWDCPRASILVIFRESTSIIFTIQVIGRIMRMPEPAHGYYQADELNKAFIFTNLSEIQVAQNWVKGYVTIFDSKRIKSLYHNINLKSIYLKRQRERTRLSGEFGKIFSTIAEKRQLKKKLKMKSSKIVNPIIVDGKITDVDELGVIPKKGTLNVEISEVELQIRFDEFIRNMCSPYQPSRSEDILKNSLYEFFSSISKFKKYDPEIQKIVLDEENYQTIFDTITLSKETYNSKIVKQLAQKREKIICENWEVPVLISYNSKYEEKKTQLSIMEPCYTENLSNPEKIFIDSLDNSKKINWWFKNGYNEPKYFAVPYVDEYGMDRGFYVDFIISFKDGQIGLFDTKSGTSAQNAGPRSNGLQKYIKSENKKGKHIVGGILIDNRGTWMYYDKSTYAYDPNDYSKWQILEI
jgi:type III restriction enzyme